MLALGETSEATDEMENASVQTSAPIPNYHWQDEAILAWRRAGGRGIIEAVTGSGKTNVGIRGLLELYREDRRISSFTLTSSQTPFAMASCRLLIW